MKARTLAIGLIATILLAQPPAALTQGAKTPATDAWDVVKAVPAEAELEVRTKHGKKARGRLLNVTDTTLRLSHKDKIADVDRENILKVYRLLPKSDEFRRLTGGIGATVGGGVGLGIGLATNQRRPIGRGSSAAFVLIPVGTALGAIGGYLIGSRQKSRLLIYESR